jgi:hypothetical protein
MLRGVDWQHYRSIRLCIGATGPHQGLTTLSRQPGAMRTKGALAPGFDLGTSPATGRAPALHHTSAFKDEKQAYHILCYVILSHNTCYVADWGASTPCGGGRDRGPAGPGALFPWWCIPVYFPPPLMQLKIMAGRGIVVPLMHVPFLKTILGGKLRPL